MRGKVPREWPIGVEATMLPYKRVDTYGLLNKYPRFVSDERENGMQSI